MTSQTSSSATTHKIYPMFLRRSEAFHWMENRFEILQQIKKLRGGWGGGIHQRPSYHGGDMTLSVRSRVKNDSLKGSPWWKSSNPNSGESWDLTWCLEVLSKCYIFQKVLGKRTTRFPNVNNGTRMVDWLWSHKYLFIQNSTNPTVFKILRSTAVAIEPL